MLVIYTMELMPNVIINQGVSVITMAKENFSKEIWIGIGFGVGFFVTQILYDALKEKWDMPSPGDFGPIDPY